MKRDFLSITDLSKDEILSIINHASLLKRVGSSSKNLSGKALVAVYEKPSLRTRLSFERAMQQLGGVTLSFDGKAIGLGIREPVKDMANVISGMADGIVLRVYSHATLDEFATNASIPVINALSDIEHPCQILADLMTILEVKGRLQDLRVAFVGDCSNNVTHSLALACAMLGIAFRCASPDRYCLDEKVYTKALSYKKANILVTSDPKEAVKNADVVITDTWISMGDEEEKEKRLKLFQDYQVNALLMKHAKKDAMFLHCMPVYRGNEVAPDVVDGKQSYIYQEAENRLYAQKALLLFLLS